MSEEKEVWVDSKGNILILYKESIFISNHNSKYLFGDTLNYYVTEYLNSCGYFIKESSVMGYKFQTNGNEPYCAIKIGIL